MDLHIFPADIPNADMMTAYSHQMKFVSSSNSQIVHRTASIEMPRLRFSSRREFKVILIEKLLGRMDRYRNDLLRYDDGICHLCQEFFPKTVFVFQ
jgi:hypothetical protein